MRKGIMKMNDSMYRIGCDCGDADHDVYIDFEIDDHIKTMTFYKNISYVGWFCRGGILFKTWKRIYGAAMLLLTGNIELTDGFIFMGDDQIESVIEILKELRSEK